MKRLDLGCGKFYKNLDYYNINIGQTENYGLDIKDYGLPNFVQCDLFTENIPYGDNSFDIVTAFDFLEHVPRILYINQNIKFSFIDLMSEIHRVLKADGLFFVSYPEIKNPELFFLDPTHVNPCSFNLFYVYFCYDETKIPRNPWAKDFYNFKGSFKINYKCIFDSESENLPNSEFICLKKI